MGLVRGPFDFAWQLPAQLMARALICFFCLLSTLPPCDWSAGPTSGLIDPRGCMASRDKYGLMVLLYMRIRPDMLPRSSTVGSVHRCHRFAVWSYKYIPSIIQGIISLIMRPWLFYRLHAGGRFPTLRLPQQRYTVSCSTSQAWEINGLSALHEIIWPPTRYINHQVIGLPFDTTICSNKFMAGN